MNGRAFALLATIAVAGMVLATWQSEPPRAESRAMDVTPSDYMVVLDKLAGDVAALQGTVQDTADCLEQLQTLQSAVQAVRDSLERDRLEAEARGTTLVAAMPGVAAESTEVASVQLSAEGECGCLDQFTSMLAEIRALQARVSALEQKDASVRLSTGSPYGTYSQSVRSSSDGGSTGNLSYRATQSAVYSEAAQVTQATRVQAAPATRVRVETSSMPATATCVTMPDGSTVCSPASAVSVTSRNRLLPVLPMLRR
jgi:hypothetical protein